MEKKEGIGILMKNKAVVIVLLLMILGLLVFCYREFLLNTGRVGCESTGEGVENSVIGEGSYSVGKNETNMSGKGKKPSAIDMTSYSDAIQIAQKIAFRRATCDTNAIPSIVLEDSTYIVTFWKHENPFYAGSRDFDAKISVDAETGEVIKTLVGRGGVGMYMLDPKSSGSNMEEKERNVPRVREAGFELNRRVKAGLPLSDAIPKEVPNVLVIARQHAKARGRQYDEIQDPMLLRIGKVYIVVLWSSPELVKDGGATYDAKVFLDVDSQMIIGMEVIN